MKRYTPIFLGFDVGMNESADGLWFHCGEVEPLIAERDALRRKLELAEKVITFCKGFGPNHGEDCPADPIHLDELEPGESLGPCECGKVELDALIAEFDAAMGETK